MFVIIFKYKDINIRKLVKVKMFDLSTEDITRATVNASEYIKNKYSAEFDIIGIVKK